MYTRQIAPGAPRAGSRRTGVAAFGSLAIAVGLAPAAGYGASWEYVPTVATGITYETNPNYVSDTQVEDDAYSGILDLAVDINRETGRSRFTFRPRTKFAVYTGADNSSDLNIADYYLPINALWADRKVQYALNAGYSQISTRDSEVIVSDPNNPGQPGSSGAPGQCRREPGSLVRIAFRFLPAHAARPHQRIIELRRHPL